MRHEYALNMRLNRRHFNRVLIDDHYKVKHHRTMSDDLIFRLVKALDGRLLDYQALTTDGWQIMVKDPAHLDGKTYRLVLCTHLDESYIGVINAFRRSYGKVSEF